MRRRRSSIVLAATAALTASVVPIGGSPPVSAASVPSGFEDVAVAAFPNATTVEWLPGDRIVVLEQTGRVRIGRPGSADFSTALTLNVCSESERGLLGFTHDPGFLGNGWVYVYATRPSSGAPGGCVNRVSRFTMVGDVIDPTSEVVLIDRISSVNGNHNGGDLDIGPDGHLYIAVGDAGRDPRDDSGGAGSNDAAEDLSLLNGKILRVTRTGQPAPGNPFSGQGTAPCAFRGNTPATPTTTCQEIYAWGLRNPYRIAFDRNDGSGRFFINDVGQGTYEEVDLGALGANYGWNDREGPCPQGATVPCAPPPAGVTDPISWYGRAAGQYITGGAVTPDGLWPAEYDGTYLFADGGSGRIWMRPADGVVRTPTEFATGAGQVVDMAFGFDDQGRLALYYVTGGGALRMIRESLPTDPVTGPLRLVPITPERAYDTGTGVGVAAGDVFNGSTRVVDLDEPVAARAALVNVTIDRSAGPGFVRTWAERGRRPGTSTVNVDGPGATVANAAVVPISSDGEFVIEATTTGRVIVDVMGWFVVAPGDVSAGRFVPLDPARLVDTRIAGGTDLDSGSPNPWSRSGEDVRVDAEGLLGLPDDTTLGAVVMSVAAVGRPDAGGFVGGYPGGSAYPGTSNVNVVPGDVRANLVVVPTDDSGLIAFRTKNVDDIVVDVVGYMTGDGAPSASRGVYRPLSTGTRVVDTRESLGFDRLAALAAESVTVPDGGFGSVIGVVQNLTATATSAPGWVATFPATDDPPFVSNLNYTAAGQTRAVAAFTRTSAGGEVAYRSRVATDLVVDVVGVFTD